MIFLRHTLGYMQKTQFEPKLREYLLLLSFVPSCALHCFYWVKGRWRHDLILHSLSWRNLPPLRLKSNGEVQSKAKLDTNVKAKKKAQKVSGIVVKASVTTWGGFY